MINLRIETMLGYLNQAGLILSEAEHVQRIVHNFDSNYIIMDEKHPIGLLKYQTSKGSVNIEQIQLLPNNQGQGIGRCLIGNIISVAKSEGSRVTLSVLKNNPAIRLYKRLGFSQFKEDNYEIYLQWTPAQQTERWLVG